MKLKLLICALLVPFVFGCATSFRESFERQADEKKWTREEKLAGLYYAYRLLFLKRDTDGSFAVVYSRLPKEDVIRQLEKNLADLEDILNYKNEEMNRFVKLFQLRPYLLRQEFVLKAVLARILADENNQKLKEFLGELNAPAQNDELGYNPKRGYDEQVLTIVDLPKVFPFKSKVVEEARAAGLLKEIARVTKSDSRELSKKEADPNDPADPNKFIWVSQTVAYELVQYKIMVAGEKPQNNSPNYVEITRVIDGKKESMPALKAFLDDYDNAVIVLDTDKEKEKIGFGLPNVVERIPKSVLFGDEMIARVFPEQKNRRIEPKSSPIRVEIVRAGAPADEWEKCPESDGCRAPASYRREPVNDNYNVRFSFRPKKPVDAGDVTRVIEYIAKEWTANGNEYRWSPGQVVEYYKPKAQCGGAVVGARVMSLENKKKVQINCQDGSEVVGMVTPKPNIFVFDKPEKIAFTIGETRWVIWDTDGDGKFDKRRKISPVIKYDVGSYPFGEDSIGSPGGGNPHGDAASYGSPY